MVNNRRGAEDAGLPGIGGDVALASGSLKDVRPSERRGCRTTQTTK